jgi:anthranilate synthase/aminodeoxychorismate synthase-like glutamine amidotransferase
MILVLDNYDSFTYILVQYIGEIIPDIEVIRNDKTSVAEIRALQPDRIVISPGPGRPEDAGLSVDVIRNFGGSIPILGICLGHQAIVSAYGGQVVRAPEIIHGKRSTIEHNGSALYRDIPSPFEATRYHSLIADEGTLPDSLSVTATTGAGLVMGVAHKVDPVMGVQYHPESVISEHGHQLIRNFLEISS